MSKQSDYSFIKTERLERIDLFASIVYFPVPADEFEATKQRIQKEQAILRAAGKDPARVSALVADRILTK